MVTKLLTLVLVVGVVALPFLSCSKNEAQTSGDITPQNVAANIQKVNLDVQGMTCTGCQYNVESALKKVPGVAEAKADYASHSAVVQYDPKKANVEQLVEAINKIGYHAQKATLN
ncbi:MAG: heavy-metal-associated domain-containing protein [Calditrichaeota bacterium]|nr:MAG: heavy-metal-associated domain-containing protein [Calditrichota bacterium]